MFRERKEEAFSKIDDRHLPIHGAMKKRFICTHMTFEQRDVNDISQSFKVQQYSDSLFYFLGVIQIQSDGNDFSISKTLV